MKYNEVMYGTLSTPSAIVQTLRDCKYHITRHTCKLCILDEEINYTWFLETCSGLTHVLMEIFFLTIPTAEDNLTVTKIPKELYKSILFEDFKTMEDTKRTLYNFRCQKVLTSHFEIDDDLIQYTYECAEWLSKSASELMWDKEWNNIFPKFKKLVRDIFYNPSDQGII